jgi:antagonist of KipI
VDLGRRSSRSLGVPLGGAADRASLALGNALVGNPPDAPALEISLTGPTLQADGPLAGVLFGAPFELRSDRQRLMAGRTFTLQPGEQLTIGGTPEGMRAYLCVHGGFEAAPLLGSRSALQPIQAGDTLTCPASVLHTRWLSEAWPWRRLSKDSAVVLRIVAGPQADWFPAESLERSAFRVTPASNRMGLRLEGRPLPLPARELVSEPVCPGTIQVTRDGQCIVLGVDGQTIGGYPKIAQVISADGDHLGQLRPGEQVRFERVELEEAEALYRRRSAELRAWVMRLRAAASLAW